MDEKWLPAVGWEGWLEVSDQCRVRTVDRIVPSKRKGQVSQFRPGKVLSPWLNSRGYWTVSMQRENSRPKQFVHVLVARTFLPGWFVGATVDHLDGVTTNNAISNFEWVTKSENSRRQNADGRGVPKGESHPGAKLSNADVPRIFQMKADGLSFSEIGRALGISASLAHKIFTGKRRKSI